MYNSYRRVRHAVESYIHRNIGIMVWVADRSFSFICALCWWYPTNLLTVLSRWPSTRPFQDTTRPHIARRTMNFFQEVGVNVLPWAPSLAYLNLIEHVWEMMERRLSTMHHPPQTVPHLIHDVQVLETRCQKQTSTICLSMPRHVQECMLKLKKLFLLT